MPKRRVRTAAQAAASRRNLVLARRAKQRNKIPRSAYHGKIVSGYHLTEPENVPSIVKNGFGPSWSTSRDMENPVWFFQSPPNRATKKRYAMGASKLSVVEARFPYRKAKKLGGVEAWYIVEAKDIKVSRRFTGRHLGGKRVR